MTCCLRITSGLGKRSNRWSSIMACAPVPSSSAGWKRLVLAISRTSSPRPERMLRVAQRVKPVACSTVILGGDRELLTDGDFGEAGVVEVRPVGDDPVGLHLQLHEGQGTVVEDDDLDRQPLLAERDQLAHQHRQSAVAGERVTTWRPG